MDTVFGDAGLALQRVIRDSSNFLPHETEVSWRSGNRWGYPAMTQRLQVYETDQVRVAFDPKVCVHSGTCLKRLPAVFDTSHRDWIDPSKASSQEVMQAVAACPSGALRASLVTSVHRVLPDVPLPHPVATATATPVCVTVRPNGSLLVEGPFRVVDPDGNVIREGEKCGLCRCGHSKNKPFCDGSHKVQGWKSD